MGRPTLKVDPRLKEWATPRQAEYLDAVVTHGGIRPAARALKVQMSAISDALKAVRKKAALQGYSPDHDWVHPVPEMHVAKGVSTYYDKDGKPRGQWVKSRLDEDKAFAATRAIIETLSQEVRGKADPLPAPRSTEAQLCNLFTITDYHVGQLSWGEETGEDWDLKIAENTLVRAFDALIESAPRAHLAVVNQLGDYLHFDGLQAVTPTAGNILDADGRFSKVVKVATRLLRHVIDQALLHHDSVIVVIAEGNHDMASSVWLRHLFGLLYENEPRVTVDQTELPYYALRHGVNFLGFHHGHLAKHEALPGIFAQQYREMWGCTKHAYIHTGHQHHVQEKEFPGANVIQHPTLAARDAYAARHGWHSMRQITSITYHGEYGQVARNTVHPEMFK